MTFDLSDLNTSQRTAVTHMDGPLLIVAGAGTGKTTVITRRIAWLISEKLAQQNNILALTFTDKAALEMEERLDVLLPYGYLSLWVSTFHSFCERILRQHAIDIGLPADFKIVSDTEQWILVRKNLERFALDYYRPLGNPTKFIHALLKHFSRCKDECVYPEKYLEYAESLKLNTDSVLTHLKDNDEGNAQEIARVNEIAKAYHIYQQVLLENNSFDFGDLVNYTLQLFSKRPNILNFYREQFKYILVDEFQDTNIAQYDLIKLLAAPKNNLTVVGDDDQAIFRFRGASVSNILMFLDDYPDLKEVFLIENYRSRQNILDISYSFIQQNNPDRLEEKLKKSSFSKRLIAKAQGKGIIDHLHFQSVLDEAQGIVAKIIELYNSSETPDWSDFAILVRANESARIFIGVLEGEKIPCIFLSNKGLYNKPIILDLVAYLKMLDDYHESRALFRLLHLPCFDISPDDIMRITHYAYKKTSPLYEVLNNIPSGLQVSETSLHHIKRIMASIAKGSALASKKNVREVVLSFLQESGYLQWITSNSMEHSDEYVHTLKQFDMELQKFIQGSRDPSAKNFIEQHDYVLEAGDSGNVAPDLEEGPELVKVMTIHSAKGLEFKYVFVVNLVDKRFPTIERKEAIELPNALIRELLPSGDYHLQEERRLFYVACTRARDGLFLSSAEDYGGARSKKLSRFLIECGFSDTAVSPKITLNTPVHKVNVTKEKLPIIKKEFSFTQLQTFEKCPLQYKFAHVLKIPVPGKGHFSFGQTMHLALQNFFELAKQRAGNTQGDLFNVPQAKDSVPRKLKDLVSLKELLQIYEDRFVDEWYQSERIREEYREKGRSILKTFYSTIDETQPLPLLLEKKFLFRLKDYTIKGRIDRVDVLTNNSVEIIDYKTGTPKNGEKLSREDKEQLLIYQMAYEQFADQSPSKLTFYYLENNERVSFIGEKEAIEKLKIRILGIIALIEEQDFTPTPGIICKFCDFNSICEFRQL